MTTMPRPATGSGIRLAELLAVLSLGTDLDSASSWDA